jgi:hypothetical protein
MREEKVEETQSMRLASTHHFLALNVEAGCHELRKMTSPQKQEMALQ